MSVQIAVIDDWQDVARDVVDWSALERRPGALPARLPGRHRHNDRAPARLRGDLRDARTHDLRQAALLQGLPNLKLLVTGGMRNAAIDLRRRQGPGHPGVRHRQL